MSYGINYNCPSCNIALSNITEAMRHRYKKNGKSREPDFYCKGCGDTFLMVKRIDMERLLDNLVAPEIDKTPWMVNATVKGKSK